MHIDNTAKKAPVTIDLNPAKLEFGRVFAPQWLSRTYENGAWQTTKILDLCNIDMHPAAIVLHYGQAIFEGMKAYKWADGSVNLFRPTDNAKRFNKSAARMAMPTLPEADFVEGIRALVALQKDWIPESPGSLYIRPSMIGTEPCIGVRAANQCLFFVITMPSGSYFPYLAGGKNDVGSIKVYVSTKVGRAAHGGTGNVKASANYAITLQSIAEGKAKGCSQVLYLDATGQRNLEEMGGMNIFFVAGKKLLTPALNDTILEGITRDSIIRLAKSMGLEVVESTLNLDKLVAQIKAGEVTEAFACGTAAVIAEIKNFLLESGESISLGGEGPGPVTNQLYDRLTGIQYGRYPDPFGWVVKV